MRISDWSSDGALPISAPSSRELAALADRAERVDRSRREEAENAVSMALAVVEPNALPPQLVAELADAEARVLIARDRKSVVSGKSVSVRLGLGGRRIIKKKKKTRKSNTVKKSN